MGVRRNDFRASWAILTDGLWRSAAPAAATGVSGHDAHAGRWVRLAARGDITRASGLETRSAPCLSPARFGVVAALRFGAVGGRWLNARISTARRLLICRGIGAHMAERRRLSYGVKRGQTGRWAVVEVPVVDRSAAVVFMGSSDLLGLSERWPWLAEGPVYA